MMSPVWRQQLSQIQSEYNGFWRIDSALEVAHKTAVANLLPNSISTNFFYPKSSCVINVRSNSAEELAANARRIRSCYKRGGVRFGSALSGCAWP
jgi:hypothetical protein